MLSWSLRPTGHFYFRFPPVIWNVYSESVSGDFTFSYVNSERFKVKTDTSDSLQNQGPSCVTSFQPPRSCFAVKFHSSGWNPLQRGGPRYIYLQLKSSRFCQMSLAKLCQVNHFKGSFSVEMSKPNFSKGTPSTPSNVSRNLALQLPGLQRQ